MEKNPSEATECPCCNEPVQGGAQGCKLCGYDLEGTPPLEVPGWKDSLSRQLVGYLRARGRSVEVLERFWRVHVAQLRYKRPGDDQNHFVRDGIQPWFRDLANTHYAIFYHLFHAHRWADRACDKAPAGVTRVDAQMDLAEEIYCFFSHGYSLVESSKCFANAVNKIVRLPRYGPARSPAFAGVSEVPGDNGRTKIKWDWKMEDKVGFRKVVEKVNANRAFLVHEQPIYPPNLDRVPVIEIRGLPGEQSVPPYIGLTAVSRLARAKNYNKILRNERFYQPTEEFIDDTLGALCDLADLTWEQAHKALLTVPGRAYLLKEMRTFDADDERIKWAELERVLDWQASG